MPHDPQKYLADMLNSSSFLRQFTAGRTVEDFRSDRGFRAAVERELQIIGEAVLQLNRIAPGCAARISQYREIISFRHVLVHGYDVVHPETVWDVIENKLSVLESEAESLLKEM